MIFTKKIILIAAILIVTAFFSINYTVNNVYAITNAFARQESVEKEKAAQESNSVQKEKAVNESNNGESEIASGKEKINGESLFDTVKKGGKLMIFLIFMGLVAMTIVIERIIFYTKNKVWHGKDIEDRMRKAAKESKAVYREDLEDELRGIFNLYTNKMERGLALLSGIGNLAPIVGFLGTVIGMISAFASIASATTVNAKVVAVGIQIALVTTAGGLIVAAPTLGFFFMFTHIIQNRFAHADEVINDVTMGMPRLSDQLNKGE